MTPPATIQPVKPLGQRTVRKLVKAATIDEVVAAVEGSPQLLARALLLGRGEAHLDQASNDDLIVELRSRLGLAPVE